MDNYVFYKDGSLNRPRGISESDYNAAKYGSLLTASYIPKDSVYMRETFSGSTSYTSTDYNQLTALKNTINYYFGSHPQYSFDNIINKPLTIYGLSSYHLGSGLRRGTVSAQVISGSTVLASADDRREDGILYDDSDNEVGFVLYKEGFVVFANTSSSVKDGLVTIQTNTGAPVTVTNYYWSYFGTSSSLNLQCPISHDTINEVPTYMIFAYADKGELNHSNNQTSIVSSSYSYTQNSFSFTESEEIKVKNTVASPFNNTEAAYSKQTYISNIGLYDKNKKLIGVANLATPIKKTEIREYLFKLKLDI